LKKNKSRFQEFITVIPFGVQRFMFYRGRRLYGLIVEAISRPGVLAAVTDKIAKRGLDITYCSTRTVKAAERGLILLFIDFTDSDIEPTTLARELRELEPIVDVRLIKPKYEGFISDDVSFPSSSTPSGPSYWMRQPSEGFSSPSGSIWEQVERRCSTTSGWRLER